MKKTLIFLSIFLTTCFSLPSFVTAQQEEDYLQIIFDQITNMQPVVENTQTSGVGFKLNPVYPSSYQETTVSLSDYQVNLNESKITWFVDDKEVRSGFGATSIKIQLGAAGIATNIEVVVDSPSTSPFTRSITIVPGEVDLLWEALDAHTPPFYRGKALPSYDSIVKITAIPNIYSTSGIKIDSGELVYTWSLNGKKRDLSAYSGYGSSTALAFADFLRRTHLVSVDVSSAPYGIETRKRTSFSLKDPEIIFYKKEPLAGINYENALGARIAASKDSSIRLVAEPYSFDMRSGFADLSLVWKLNNDTIRHTETLNWGEIPLVTQNSGMSRLNLAIKTNKALQDAKVDLEIITE